MKAFLIPLFFMLIVVRAHGQDDIFTELVDQLSGSQEFDLDYSELVDIWQNYISQPLSLKELRREDLYALQFLSESEVEAIINYLNFNKPISSVYELQAIEGIRLSVLPYLAKFIEFPSELVLRSTEGKGEITITQARTIQQKQGFQKEDGTSAYQGTRNSINGRIKYQVPYKFKFGLLFENDAGESFQHDPKNKHFGFDHNSFYLKIENPGPLDELIIGNFSVGFGQGLGIGSSFSLGLNSQPVLSAFQVARGIRPFTSSSENSGLRGLATSTSINDIKITAIASHKNIDTNLGNDSISSFLTAGLHRSVNELSKRKNSSQTDIGLEVSHIGSNHKISAHVFRTHLSGSFSPSLRPYQQFSFVGETLLVSGISGNINISNLMVFGELSRANNSWASLAGLILALDKRTSLAITARNYSESYYSFHSGAFGRNSSNRNENGVYLGITSQLTPKLKLSGFYDTYKFPWLRFQQDAPGNGARTNISGKYEWRNSTISLQLRAEQGTITDNDQNLDFTKNQIQLSHKHDYGSITLTTKVQQVLFNTDVKSEHGLVLLQDIKKEWNKIRVIARLAAFNTDSYATRIYNYEHDVSYAFNFPAYHGKGYRTYYLIKYTIRNVDINFRLSQTTFTDRQIIGAGNEKILGNSKTDVKLQVKIKI